jgi:site-specific DNA-cytosine methylase
MRALTLFAGGGGSCMGMVQAGLTVTGAIEIDPVIAGVYRQNLGDNGKIVKQGLLL